MATEYSIQKMVSDGTLSTIALGIQYLQRNDIYIRIAGEGTPQSGAPSGYTWSFLDNTTLKILPVVPNGVEVVVYRRTDVDAMYNIYSQNAQFDEATIDENNQQLLYIAQEYLEQGLPGAGVDTIEFLRDDGTNTYYRIKRTDGSYSEEFAVPSASSSTKVLTRESLRRSYAEAGYNLVDGSFEAGGTLVNANDVLLQERTGKAFSGPAGVVAEGTNPASGGFTDGSGALLRSTLPVNINHYFGPAEHRISAMLTDLGFVAFPQGGTEITTATIDGDCYFEDGAYLTITGTVTITGRIMSTKQWIFRGGGQVLLRNDANSGEDSRNIHASWFGVFPVNDAATDMAPRIAKMFLALDNSREAVVDFDVGRYPVGASCATPRATWVRGSGSRRTVFEVLGTGYDVFTALANGVRFSGIQFELSDDFPTAFRESGYYINSNQQLVELEDVWVGKAAQNILLSGGKSTAKQIRATFDVDTGVGSSVITLEASDSRVEDVMVVGDEFGPESIVSIGGAGLNNIASATVDGVRSNCKSIPVLVSAKSKLLTAISVNDVGYRGMAGFEAPVVVATVTSGTGSIAGLVIDGVIANDKAVGFIHIRQGSTGGTRNVTIESAVGAGGSGVGLLLERTAGTLDGVTVDQTVNVSGYMTPIQRTGVMSNISLSPVAIPNTAFPISYDAIIPDDGVFSIDMSSSAFTGVVLVTVGFTEFAQVVARAVSTAQITPMQKSANIDLSTSTLNGTTGVDGKFTVSSTPGRLYFENRLGSSQRVSVSLMYGAK